MRLLLLLLALLLAVIALSDAQSSPNSSEACPLISFPNITGMPEPVNVTEGQPLVVQCMCLSDNAANITVEWNRGPAVGMPARGETASLNFTAVSSSDSGVYICSSSDGTEANFTLLVEDAPLSVSVMPMSLAVLEGSNVTLECTASGGTPRTYSWQRNGEDIQGQNMNTLNIINITTTMDWNYSCTAGNGAGNFTSPIVQLNVSDANLSVSVMPMSLAVLEGSNVTLECTISGGTPRTYSWQRNGVDIQGQNMSTLNIINITATMDGNYSCTAGNGAGNFNSSTVRLAVFGILNLAVVEGGQLVVSSGDSLKLTCVASLDPDTPEDAVSLTWTGPQGSSFTVNQSMKEGTNLTRVLSVAVVGPEDGGTYTCSVSVVSGGGSMNRAAIVDITVLNLNITFPTGNTEILEVGDNFTVSCTAEVQGNMSGVVEFFWEMEGEMVSSSSLLTIYNVSQNDRGVYTCVAMADGMTRTANLTLTVVGVPDQVVSISSVLNGLTAVNLFWTPPPDNGRNITNYLVQLFFGDRPLANITDPSISVTSLSVNTTYMVQITAVNSVGQGSPRNFNFSSANPVNTVVQNITGDAPMEDPFSLNLRWMPPAGLEDLPVTYTIEYGFVGSDFNVTSNRQITTQTSTTSVPSLNLTDLLPNSTYTAMVVANYSEGNVAVASNTALMEVSTGGLIPSLFPAVTQRNDSVDNTVVTVVWVPVNVIGQELPERLLSGYRVRLIKAVDRLPSARANQPILPQTIDVNRSATSVMFTNLAYYYNYSYEVLAVYSFRDIELYAISGAVGIFSTGEGVPNMATSLRNTSLETESLAIQWNASSEPNGVVTYEVTVTRKEQTIKQVTTSALTETIVRLGHSRRYTVTVVPRTSAGPGRPIVRMFWTSAQIDPLPISQDPIQSMSSVVTIKLPGTSGDHDLAIKYYVFVLRNTDTLSTAAERLAARPQPYTGAANQQYYTAAVLDSFKYMFPLGDGTTSEDGGVTYTNAPLQAGSAYYYFVQYRITVPSTEVEASVISVRITINPQAGVDTAIIAVVVVLLLLIIAVIAFMGFLLYWFRRGRPVNSDIRARLVSMSSLRKPRYPYLNIEESLVSSSAYMPTLLYVEVSADNAEVSWSLNGEVLSGDRFKVLRGGSLYISDTQPSDAGTYTVTAVNTHGTKEGQVVLEVVNPTPPDPDPDHPVIAVEGLLEHVELLRANDGFADQYESLNLDWELTNHHSRAPCNQGKNRFINISPYDHCRVVLESCDDEPGSDYINASFLDGYKKTKAYIASQGPTASSIDDFWRMIWQYNVPTIVMVTKLEEGRERTVVKCNQYWPDSVNIPRLYGDIKVTMTEEEELAVYCVRKFSVQEYGNEDSTRHVQQFHFLAWPDHGVPDYPTDILTFHQCVRTYHNRCNNAGPMVVHCSAGVGRTGTFVTLDTSIQMMETENKLDVFNFVRNLRWRRNYMVQTESQYVFIYDALAEFHSCGDTSIVARNLKKELNHLESNGAEGQTGYQLQFEKLLAVSPKPESMEFTVAEDPVNKGKNRSPTALPPDAFLVELSPDSSNPGYINASYIDGYRQLRAFISTQAPLPSTVEDLWQMVWEQETRSLVALTTPQEIEQDQCCKYWPSAVGEAKQFGRLTVELTSEDSPRSEYVVRKLRVWQENKQEEGRLVTQFHFLQWPDGGCPNSATPVVELVNDLQRVQRQSGNRPITVHCSDGVSRTGAFCALVTALERVKTEQIVDVFKTVKSLRIQRLGMVTTVDQYKFVHEAILEYLTSFEGYSNFT